MYINFNTLIAIAGAIIGLAILGFFFYLKKKQELVTMVSMLTHKTQNDEKTRAQYLSIMRNALKQLNINYEETWLNANKDVRYTFQYQSGNFSLFLPMSDFNVRGFSLHFPYIYTTTLDALQAIRTTCNEANNASNMARAFYFIDDEKSQIDVHLTCHIPFTIMSHELSDNLADAMQECFSLQRIITERIEQLDRQATETHFSDLEYAQSDLLEQVNWINKAEVRHTQNEADLFTDHIIQSIEECMFGEWFFNHETLPPDSKLLKMICDSDDGYHFSTEDPEEIYRYVLAEPIVHKLVQAQAPKVQSGCIRVAYQRKEDIGTDKKHWITLYVENVGINENVLYIRVNYMLPEKSTNPESEFKPSNGYARVTGGSLVIGYDWKDGRHKQTEFDYMWNDAQDKIKEGKTDEWTPEQKLIHSITNAEVAYDIYWGKRFTRQKRYYEASLHLTRAYNTLNEEFYTNENSRQSLLFEVSFMLGHCYIEMKRYKTAFFYLQTLSASNVPMHIEEMINCLVALKDFRCEQAINFYREHVKMQIEEYLENDKEIPESLQQFRDFLRRQDVYISIERHFFEKAENLCYIMLNEKGNKDFALSELRHIQRLREKGVEEIPTSLIRPINNLF